MSKMAPVRKSEEEVGRIWDRCLIDTAIKSVTGVLVGSVFSLIFFKRKAWPITLGLGVGLGAGYTNCRHQFWSRRHSFEGNKYRHGGPPYWRKQHKKDKQQQNAKIEEASASSIAEQKPQVEEHKS